MNKKSIAFDFQVMREFGRRQAYRISYDPIWRDLIAEIIDRFEVEVSLEVERLAIERFEKYTTEFLAKVQKEIDAA